MSERYVRAAGVHELPAGEMRAVKVAGLRILLVNVGGAIHALSALCPHEDAPLVKGYVKDGCLHCPLHGSYFDLRSGEVLAEPASEALTVYPVRVIGTDIEVGLPAS